MEPETVEFPRPIFARPSRRRHRPRLNLPPGWKRYLLMGCIALSIYFIGANAGSTHTDTPYSVIKTVAVPGPTVTVPAPEAIQGTTVSVDCLNAIEDLNKLAPAVRDIINVSTPAMDALSAGELALIQHDQKAMIAATNRIQQLQNGLSGPADTYMSLLQDFNTATKSCS